MLIGVIATVVMVGFNLDGAVRSVNAYRVHAEPVFILRADVVSAALQETHDHHRATCRAFLTTCNPCSRSCSPENNVSRQASLLSDIRALNLEVLPGVGQNPDLQRSCNPNRESLKILM